MLRISNSAWELHGKLLTADLSDLSEEAVEELNENGEWKLHQERNENVQVIWINCIPNLSQLPSNLGEIFPNAKVFYIEECGLEKISRSDLKGFKCLKDFQVFHTEIEELPADLFADNKDIERIEFGKNRIKFIGKDLFKDMKSLKYVDLSQEAEIGLSYAEKDQNVSELKPGFTRLFKLQHLNAILNDMFHSQKSIDEDIHKVLESNDFKDFAVKVGTEEFKVHKFLLIARSPTLAEMIKNNPDADELILEDIEVEVFKIILDYIYEDELPEVYDEWSEKIFVAAAKLRIERLKRKVEEILYGAVNAENCCRILKLALNFDHNELKAKAFEEFKKFFPNKELRVEDSETLKRLIDRKEAYDEKLKQMKEEFENFAINLT